MALDMDVDGCMRHLSRPERIRLVLLIVRLDSIARRQRILQWVVVLYMHYIQLLSYNA